MENIIKSKVFQINEAIPLKKNHTISKSISHNKDFKLTLFSLAACTDVSREFYDNISIFSVMSGKIQINENIVEKGEILISDAEEFRKVMSDIDSIYFELSFNTGDDFIMKNIEKGKIIDLKDAIEYVDGGISNLDIVSKDNLKIVLMAFDANQGLSPHSAPGDAMVIALEGKADLLVGEETFEINAGEQFIFPKNITHNVTAKDDKFKMALILVVDEEN